MSYNLGLKTKTFGAQISILDSQHVRYIRGAVTIDKDKVSDGFNQTIDGKTYKILPAGVPLAKNGTSGKYVPVRSSVVTAGGGTGVTSCTVDEPKLFMPGDVVTIGANQVTLDSVDYNTGQITWTGGVDVNNGDKVIGTGGEGKAICLLAEEVDVTDADQVATAFDHARVIEARLPVKISDQIKSDLNEVKFV